ncbi:MAG: hypothetical protein IJ574_01990 [Bacilli bacterium]|nr:hypothetical protein [Bacilli bacterium]
MNSKSKKIIVLIVIVTIIIISLGSTYAVWSTKTKQTNKNIAAMSCLDITYTDESSGITLNDAIPIIDSESEFLPGYTFSIVNNCETAVKYEVNLESLNIDGLPSSDYFDINYMNVSIDNDKVGLLGTLDKTTSLLNNNVSYDSRKIYTGILDPANKNINKTHTIKIWLDETTPKSEIGKTWQGKVTLNGSVMLDYVGENATAYITKLYNNKNSELEYDNTSDNNLRYVGKNPNNYVLFNDELWRIIGVMNNIDGGESSGENATRVKLIGPNLLYVAYDSKCVEKEGGCLAPDFDYSNNWAQSTLANLLNDAYLFNKKSGVQRGSAAYYLYASSISYPSSSQYPWYYYDFTSKGIKEESRNIIEPATYYLGAPITQDENTAAARDFYVAERTNKGENNDLTWTGIIALMYPSDYGFASNATVSGNRCTDIALYEWKNKKDCTWDSNWLDDSISHTLTPRSTGYSDNFVIEGDSYIFPISAYYEMGVLPVLYLKSSVEILSGEGTKNNPYTLRI